MFVVIGASALLWPLVHWWSFRAQFPGGVLELSALVFAPMGAIAGGFLAYWLREAASQQQRLLVVLGYLVASPLAFLGSLAGTRFFENPLLGLTLFGALPLVLGCFFGWMLGRRFREA